MNIRALALCIGFLLVVAAPSPARVPSEPYVWKNVAIYGGGSRTRINDDQHQYAWIGQAVSGDPRVYGRVYLATNGRGILYADPKMP